MSAEKRYQIATDTDFQHRVEAVLFYGATLVLTAEAGTYDNLKVAAAKKVINGLVDIASFCKLLVNEETFGPLVDAAASQAALTDVQIYVAVPKVIDVLAAAAI